MGTALRSSAGALLTEDGISIPGQVRHIGGVLPFGKKKKKLKHTKKSEQAHLLFEKKATRALGKYSLSKSESNDT